MIEDQLAEIREELIRAGKAIDSSRMASVPSVTVVHSILSFVVAGCSIWALSKLGFDWKLIACAVGYAASLVGIVAINKLRG